MSNTFDKLGPMTIIAQADVLNLQSAVNKKGDTRVGGESFGKRGGLRCLIKLTSGGTLSEVFALGPKSSDAFRTIDGSTNYTPVNILNAGGGAAWTETSATYAAGVLDATTATAVDSTQDVVLKAGTYILSGEVGRELATTAPKVVVTGATDGIVATKVYDSADVSTTYATKSVMATKFTIAVDQTVTFDLSVVTIATGATVIGEGYINFVVEASNPAV